MIPPITHKLGKYWDQPDPANIEVDDTHALMEPSDFCHLVDYSHSQPTGLYPGKMWKRKQGSGWILCWVTESEKGEDFCTINYRDILLT